MASEAKPKNDGKAAPAKHPALTFMDPVKQMMWNAIIQNFPCLPASEVKGMVVIKKVEEEGYDTIYLVYYKCFVATVVPKTLVASAVTTDPTKPKESPLGREFHSIVGQVCELYKGLEMLKMTHRLPSKLSVNHQGELGFTESQLVSWIPTTPGAATAVPPAAATPPPPK